MTTGTSSTDALPMNELGFYTLAGAPESPRDLIDEVRAAEEMGLGSAFVSERLNIKEAATICGAVGASGVVGHSPRTHAGGLADADAGFTQSRFQ